MRWKELYKNEEELLNDLVTIDIEKFKQKRCKGYVYIQSFQNHIKTKGELTKNQLTQLKRLAPEIYKYHNSYAINGVTRQRMRD